MDTLNKEYLIRDTLNKGHLSIRENSFRPVLILYERPMSKCDLENVQRFQSI
jgi:hypothetical protein